MSGLPDDQPNSPWSLVGRIVFIAGTALGLLAMFLPWRGGDFESENAWETLRGGDIIILLLGLVALGLAITLFFVSHTAIKVSALWVSALVASLVLTLAALTFDGKVGIYLDALLWLSAAAAATLLWFEDRLPAQSTASAYQGLAAADAPPTGPPAATATAATAAPPPAGWYADPAGGSGKRYWSGAEWTDQTR